MHIVHVDRQRSLTGQVRRGFTVAKAVGERGHEVGLIAQPGAELGRLGRETGLPVLELSMRGVWLYPSVLRAARRLRGRRIDILHCHGARDQFFALLLARLIGIRHVIRTKHNHTPPHGRTSLRRYLACSQVVAVSDFVRDTLIDGGLPPEHLETIPDGVDVERFSPRPRDGDLARSLGLEPDDVVIGNLSSLHQRKGIEDVLRAFVRLLRGPHADRLKCLLVGKNREPWAALARQLGIEDRVILPGFRSDVPEMLALFDVYVLTSRHEALGTSVLEVMAMQRPVVVSDVGGLAQSVTDATGIRVSPGDVDAVTAAVGALLDDPERARRMGVAGRERVTMHFSADTLVERTLELYARVLAKPGGLTLAKSSTKQSGP